MFDNIVRFRRSVDAERQKAGRFDELALFETVAMARTDLETATDSIYGAYRAKEHVTPAMIASVRSACRSALAALEQYEAGIRPSVVPAFENGG